MFDKIHYVESDGDHKHSKEVYICYGYTCIATMEKRNDFKNANVMCISHRMLKVIIEIIALLGDYNHNVLSDYECIQRIKDNKDIKALNSYIQIYGL